MVSERVRCLVESWTHGALLDTIRQEVQQFRRTPATLEVPDARIGDGDFVEARYSVKRGWKYKGVQCRVGGLYVRACARFSFRVTMVAYTSTGLRRGLHNLMSSPIRWVSH